MNSMLNIRKWILYHTLSIKVQSCACSLHKNICIFTHLHLHIHIHNEYAYPYTYTYTHINTCIYIIYIYINKIKQIDVDRYRNVYIYIDIDRTSKLSYNTISHEILEVPSRRSHIASLSKCQAFPMDYSYIIYINNYICA